VWYDQIVDTDKRRRAVKLRLSGKSYSEIKELTGATKSSLSYWLKNYPLTVKQAKKLKARYKDRQIESFIKTMRLKREVRNEETYARLTKILLPLTEKELGIAGLFLYLGEGSKHQSGQILVSNTDPSVIKFVMRWYENYLDIPKDEIKVGLQLYGDMNIKEEISYWSTFLAIPVKNFWKPYIKNSAAKSIDHTGHKHGTCTLYHGSVPKHEEIMMSIKCILDEAYRLRA
jgi:predicted transcriptional regulator